MLGRRLSQALISAIALSKLLFATQSQFPFMSTSGIATTVPLTREEWRQALNDLPEVKEIDGQKKIPAFFFAHGS